jgi:hypothetical protein
VLLLPGDLGGAAHLSSVTDADACSRSSGGRRVPMVTSG